ncbi:SDR family NAD(P)-dependent oxidoreductase [Cytobacillus suaedae]|nr:SDR family NAD(P)-dependent oxidoreductase [Cytobacillus suaedae]
MEHDSCCYAALLKTHGHVINVASGLALVNVGYSAAYSASKRAIAAYSDVLRQEYGDRIDVTTLYPAFIKTPIHEPSEKDNTSLADIVRPEPVEFASKALLKAILTKPRDLSTSHVSNFQLFMARHFRRSLDKLLRDKMKKAEKIKGKPTFVRDFDKR